MEDTIRINKNGELFIFNYAPKLRIVGTYHSLTEKDKVVLEKLVLESDFVALESDQSRINPDLPLCLDITLFKSKINKDGEMYFSLIDVLYITLFEMLNERRIKEANTKFGREIIPDQDEFVFCYEKARQFGKDVHLVDVSYLELWGRLVSLPLGIKFRHLWAMYNGGSCPQEVNCIITNREDTMLENIAKKEGPITQLNRQGLLVTGVNHAVNYYSSLYPTEIRLDF